MELAPCIAQAAGIMAVQDFFKMSNQHLGILFFGPNRYYVKEHERL